MVGGGRGLAAAGHKGLSHMIMLSSRPRQPAAWRVLVLLGVLLFASSAAAPDPLPSWKEGEVKQVVLSFVATVSTPGSEGFVPEQDRVAVFDNDGTLWPENPIPAQLAFVQDEIRRRAAAEPGLAVDSMVQALLAGDTARLLAGPHHDGLMHLVALTHTGMTTDEFRSAVLRWMETASHPRFDRRYDQLAYQPMLELLQLLRAHGFRTFIVSGGGADFMRVWSESVYGIPPDQVIGSTARVQYELRESGPVLVKTLEQVFVDDKAGKPAAIHQFIGKRPIAAFGNSDGDKQMLEYVTIGNPYPSLGMIIRHTDADREYLYDVNPKSSGTLVEALADAPARGWHVVSMKDDWTRIFPER